MDNNTLKTKILIVDDDCLSREVLRRALTSYAWVNTASEAENMDEACRMAAATQPDIIFLDIRLDSESALDRLTELREASGNNPAIVFYTLYQKYMMQALRMEAFDFLLKPFDTNELNIIMNRYKLEACRRKDCQSPETYMPAGRLDSHSHYQPRTGISVTTITNDRMILFPRDIVFFRYDSERKLWEAVLTTLQRIILKRNTNADTILNYGDQFVRTHKAFIVNVEYISMLSANECCLVPPFQELDKIKISKIYRRQLLDRFYDL